jgi:DNA-binding NtrC family response regulator
MKLHKLGIDLSALLEGCGIKVPAMLCRFSQYYATLSKKLVVDSTDESPLSGGEPALHMAQAVTSILVAEPRVSVRETIGGVLRQQGLSLIPTSVAALVPELERKSAAMAIIGPSLANVLQLRELAGQIRQCTASIPLLLLVPSSSEELAIAALRAGIVEYLTFPCGPAELTSAVYRCLQPFAGRERNGDQPLSNFGPAALMIGESRPMQKVKEDLCRIAVTDSNILITGETGTGKELAAELIHLRSPRRCKPLLALNCAAIPDSLLESELFGYERGAFTGAQSSRDGKLKEADGGTILLDEIGDMSPYAQAKILRVIDGKQIQRLGGAGISVNVRIIAATNQELEALVRAERFRKDLYFRLNVARVHLPPLRERKEDIPSIVDHYVRHFNNHFGRNVQGLTESAWRCLFAHDWPGNVRELKNLLEGIFIHTSSVEITPDELPVSLYNLSEAPDRIPGDERARLLSALVSTNWNKSKAADKLRWSRMTLYRKMAKHHVTSHRRRHSGQSTPLPGGCCKELGKTGD